jgi:cytochrome c oxidase subunit 2
MPDWLQSALRPAGPAAASVHRLWGFMWWTSVAVFVLVIGALAWGTFHRRVAGRENLAEGAPGERRIVGAVSAAVVLTVLTLFVFLVFDFSTGRALTAPRAAALRVEVTGHQWWWEVSYYNDVPSKRVTTANEIHIPVGRPVLLRLNSQDVIHSFWAPDLNGKRDLIPGKESSLWIQADSPGVYRGQCAEFCGYQHAKMAFLVVADRPADFAHWYAAQSDTAKTPTDSLTSRGQEVFLASPCAMCHAIQGTPAGATMGPDLTHVASRRYLAAGTLPNTRGNLAGWILDAQGIKPGAHMPPNSLTPADLQALLAYMGTLK